MTLVPKQANDPNKYPHADVYLKMEDDGKSIIAHLTKEIDSVIFKDLMDTSNSKLTDIRIEFAVGGVILWSPDYSIGITMHERLELKLLK